MKFEDVEKARLAYVEKAKSVRKKAGKVLFFVFLGIIILLIIISVINEPGTAILSPILIPSVFQVIFVPMIFALIIYFVIFSVKTKKELADYRRSYKGYFVGQQLAKVFTNLQYNHEAGLSESILSSTGMINTGDRYLSNDLVIGKYKDVGFTQADVHIDEEHTDSDGDTHYVTIFRGRYMIFEFPKKFDFRMIVTPGRVYGVAKSKNDRQFKKIELESTEFNKKFNVYAEDGFEAFYILDPAFIASIEELGRVYNYRLALYFTDNKLIIGINNGNDSFEPPKPTLPLDESAEIEKISKDILVITNFVDELRLDH